MSKRWTYNQITAHAEAELRHYDEMCRMTHVDKSARELYRDMAAGAFAFWRSLTIGWMNAGDIERLEALKEAVGAQEEPTPN